MFASPASARRAHFVLAGYSWTRSILCKGTVMATTFDSIASGADGSTEPSIDADGNLVAFETAAQQVYVENMQSGAVTLVSQTSAGVQSNLGSQLGAISSDGSSV